MNLKISRPRAPSPVAALAPAVLYAVAFANDQIDQPKPAFRSRPARGKLQATEGQCTGQEKGKVCELCG